MHAQEIAMMTESDRHVKILDGPPDLCPNGSFVIEMPGSIYSGSFPVFDAEYGVRICLIVNLSLLPGCEYEPSPINISILDPNNNPIIETLVNPDNGNWPPFIHIGGNCVCSDELGYYTINFDGPASCYQGTVVANVSCNDPRCP